VTRILVIDDAPVIFRLCREILTEVGYEVEGAADGAEGMLIFRKRPADLVLCDLLMPVKDGCQTIRELRAISSVPIVVMNGRGSFLPGLKTYADALRAGATRTLQKPFTSSELLTMVGEILQPVG
jgi:two-component system, chemotaxis family, chemotaxis protein CheY